MTVPHRVLVSGASGLIGTALIRAMTAHRIQTLQLVRGKPRHSDQVSWNPAATHPISEPEAIEQSDAAIHLSGANLSSRRWTAAYKKEILDSRVLPTRALVKAFRCLKSPPRLLLCASATGIYGNRGDEILTEESLPGSGFLADVCRAWEAEAAQAQELGIRVLHLRFGVVLSPQGGALAKMLPLFRLGLGGRLGSGRQWMSWIALPDLTRAVLFLLDGEADQNSGPISAQSPAQNLTSGSDHVSALSGPVDLTAPNPVINADFTHSLAHALHRPTLLPAPAFALRAAFGKMADDALLSSARVLPDRLLRAGFQFELPTVDAALKSLL